MYNVCTLFDFKKLKSKLLITLERGVKLNILSEKKLENAIVELEIEVPVERVEIEYKSVFNKIQRNAKIDGFRQGKAPLQIIEKKYREYAGEEVAENIAKSTFYDAATQKELAPIVEPRISYDSISRDEPFKYKAIFEVMPTIELSEYTGVETETKVCNVTDEDVNSEIDVTREKLADIEVISDESAVVANGNLVRFDLKRTDNLSAEDAEKAEYKEYEIVVGKSKDEYTLDKHFIGMKKGEEKTATISYPADYHMSEFAGQSITYSLKLKGISSMKLPDLDDEFAKKSGYESADDMKKKTRDYLEKYVKDRITAEVKNDLITKIAEKSTFDIPESMIANEMYSIFKKTQQRVGFNAENIEQFAMALGMEAEEYRNILRTDAIKSIRHTLILSEVAKKEELKVSEERFQEFIANISAQIGKTVQEVQAMVDENRSRDSIEQDIVLDNAMQLIYEKARIKELPPVSLERFIRSNMR